MLSSRNDFTFGKFFPLGKCLKKSMKVKQRNICDYADSKTVMLPVFDALDVLRGRWRIPIILSLTFGNKRFSEISKEVTGISDKILAKELKEMQINKLITRTIYETFPPTVEYSITDHGRMVEKILIELKNFGELHRNKVLGK